MLPAAPPIRAAREPAAELPPPPCWGGYCCCCPFAAGEVLSPPTARYDMASATMLSWLLRSNDAVALTSAPPAGPLPLLLLALPLVVVVVAGPPSRGSSVRRGSGTVTSSSTRSSHPRHQIVIVVVDGEALQGIIGGGGGGIGGRGREVHIYCLLRSNVVTIHRSALAHMPWPMAAMAMAHGSAADAVFLLVMARACRANL